MKSKRGFSPGIPDYVLVKAILVSLVVLLTNTAAQAQHEADNWIFGNGAGLNFSTGSPVAFGGSAINTLEGSSSISDQSGQLLFYTDGKTVWNKNNLVMTGGTGLLGGASATQSALIVPWPNTECKKYFIFTVSEMKANTDQTLSYSVVDMSSGLGAVTTKNTFLKSAVSEKLSATKDANGTGFWLVAHGFSQSTTSVNKEFYAYHVTGTTTATNLVGTQVTSTVGFAHQNGTNELPSAGQMKISPDGRLIASAVNTVGVEILNFDNSVTTTGGVVSGPPRTYNASASSLPFNSIPIYGLEFSHNSQVLYMTTTFGPSSKLFQLDVSNSASTWTLIFTAATRDMAQLQLGPNNKIYVARDNSNQLGVINSPTSLGTAAGYTASGPTLSSGDTSLLGLPTMIGGSFSCAPCGTISEPRVTCERGVFTYTFMVTNNSTQTIQYLLLSPPAGATFTISPNIINLGANTLGQGQSTTVSVTITNASPGDHICINVALADRNVVPCCTIQTCVDLPDCCLRFSRVSIACGANGSYTYTVTIQNVTGVAINQIFIVPTQLSNLNISPQLITLTTPLQQGGQTTITITITGAPPGINISLWFTPLGDNGASCCSVERRFTLQDCHP